LIEREDSQPQDPTVAPEAEATEPEAEATEPQPEATESAAEPQAETAEPQAETAEPQAETAEPQAETAEPQAETAAPEGSEAQPEPAAPTAPEAPAEEQPVRTLAELAADARYSATGKRKTSVARVIIRPGTGQFELNGRPLEVYFPRRAHQTIVRSPLEIVGFAERVDVRARIHGGGISGQADAVRHGIAKALIEADPALRSELKRRQLLTRDPREKERRKAGLKKARKRPQFSKR
jgi:small subunit ribosomal protein S9